MNHIAIIDYGMGNFHSVRRALLAAAPDQDIRIARNAKQIAAADRIVFPGQGAMPDCMQTLKNNKLEEAVIDAAKNKPLLGICIGEQILFKDSTEGPCEALGVLNGHIKKFQGPEFSNHQLKIPHMGWNLVHQEQEHPLWQNIAQSTPFYFVHSYYAEPLDSNLTVGTSVYGKKFCCAVAQDNIFAVQFHPEKSAAAGLQLYRNFIQWQP